MSSPALFSSLQMESKDEELPLPSSQFSLQSTQEVKSLPRATLEQKIKVLDWHAKNGTKSQRYTVSYFQSLAKFAITKSSFNRWCKDEKDLRFAYANLNQFEKGTFKRKLNYSIVDYCMIKYFEQSLFDDLQFSKKELISKCHEFNHLINVNYGNEEKSNSWVHYFKQKNQLKKKLIMEFNDFKHSIKLDDEIDRLKTIIASYHRSDVFHIDEVCLSSRVLPINHISNKFIVGIGMNSDITEFLPLFIVSRTDKLKSMLDYYQSNTSLLTSEIFHAYLTKLNKQIHDTSPDRKILLLLDRLYQHVINTETLNHIEICWFDNKYQTPTSRVDNNFIYSSYEIQPLNMGIIKSFKLIFKNDLFKHYLVTLKDGYSGSISSSLMYELIQDTWRALQQPKYRMYLLECWETSNILPRVHNRKRDYSLIENNLEKVFWKLLSLIEQNNRLSKPLVSITLSLNEILFPKDELLLNRSLTDHEILELVQLEQDSQKKPTPECPQLTQMATEELKASIKLINPMIFNQLNMFFNKNQEIFPDSNAAFQKLLHCYIKESIDSLIAK